MFMVMASLILIMRFFLNQFRLIKIILNKIVGIFGLSHIHGILKAWNENVDIKPLLTPSEGIDTSAALFEKVSCEILAKKFLNS